MFMQIYTATPCYCTQNHSNVIKIRYSEEKEIFCQMIRFHFIENIFFLKQYLKQYLVADYTQQFRYYFWNI